MPTERFCLVFPSLFLVLSVRYLPESSKLADGGAIGISDSGSRVNEEGVWRLFCPSTMWRESGDGCGSEGVSHFGGRARLVGQLSCIKLNVELFIFCSSSVK